MEKNVTLHKKSARKYDHIGHKKQLQYEKVLESIKKLNDSLSEFDEEERKNLKLFVSAIQNDVLSEVEKAINSGEPFGCWLYTNRGSMYLLLDAIPQVKYYHYDHPRVRAIKEDVIDAVEDLLNIKARFD